MYFVKVLDPSRKKPATAEKPSLSASFLNQKRFVWFCAGCFFFYESEHSPLKGRVQSNAKT